MVLSPSPVSGMSGARLALGVALAGSMPGASFRAYSLRGQMRGDLDEVRVAQVAGPVAVGPAHGLGHAGAAFPATSGPCFFRSKFSRMLSICTRLMPPELGGGGRRRRSRDRCRGSACARLAW